MDRNEFTLEKKLGEGNFGSVWKGEDDKRCRLNKEFVDLFGKVRMINGVG